MKTLRIRLKEAASSPLFRKLLTHSGLAVLFFLLSFSAIYVIHRFFADSSFRVAPALLKPSVLITLFVLLVLYFLSDGLRLYAVLRTMGVHIPFVYLIKLVFVNIFVSNVTPLATGGGVVQVYFMSRKGLTVGQATAVTSIRTILAALTLFVLAPIILLAEPTLFDIFSRQHLIGIVVVFSTAYIIGLLIIVFRISLVRRFLYHLLAFLHRVHLLSRRRYRRWFFHAAKETRRFSSGFRDYFRGDPVWILLSVALTLLFLLMLFSFSVVLITALGYDVSAWTILSFQVVITFFMYFAPTPGATGVAEGGYGLLFATLVSRRDIALLTLAWRFLTIYVGVIIGIVITYVELFRKKDEVLP